MNAYPYVSEYLAFVKWANITTAAGKLIKLRSFDASALDQAGWKREFRRALNLRINIKGHITQKSRYCPSDLRSSANFPGFIRDQLRLKDIRRRICVYQFETRAVRERFSHLLSSYEEF